jgi:hypothetical protein
VATLRIGSRNYSVVPPSLRDPRLHVAVVLLGLQALGQAVLGFRLSIAQILACLAAGALIEFVVAFFKDRAILWPASGLLTGNSAAFILRVPGTVHGQWWSLHGIWIFIAVVAVSMASKYLIRWRGRHIFNPSNLGLVLAFVALGPKYTEPLDLWWAPIGPWMLAAYAVLLVGGLLIGWELKLLGLELGFAVGFAGFLALALAPAPDHCLVASWHATAICGGDLWQLLVTSPEVLLFALFMVPDPRTVPESPLGRILFGLLVGLLAALLIGPTLLEFWAKTAILASLAIACAARFLLIRALAPIEAGGGLGATVRRVGWRLPVATILALLLVEALPVSAGLSTHGTEPAAGRGDASPLTVTLQAGGDAGIAGWLTAAATVALPPPGHPEPVSGSAYVWVVPDLPAVEVAEQVTSFDSSITPDVATRMAHDAVLDLIIESEARRQHDVQLATDGAEGDALDEFTSVIDQDQAAGSSVEKRYSFDRVALVLYLPKFNTQASRLVGVALRGTTTITVRDAAGHQLSQTTAPYAKSWGLDSTPAGGHSLIINDYTDLAPA